MHGASANLVHPWNALSVRSGTDLSWLLPCSEAAPQAHPLLLAGQEGRNSLISGPVAGEAWRFMALLLPCGLGECLDRHMNKASWPHLLRTSWLKTEHAPGGIHENGSPFALKSSRWPFRGEDARSQGPADDKQLKEGRRGQAEPTWWPSHWTAGLKCRKEPPRP